jgi:peptide/nickel transport system substrate-binding protein
MKKKKVWASLAAASLALVLAACGDEDKSADSSTSASTETKELTVGMPNDVGPINLYTESEDWLNEMVYDKLMASSPYVDEPTPWLAESVKQIDDKTWEVKVRDGIK